MKHFSRLFFLSSWSGKVIKIGRVEKKTTESLLNKLGPKDLAGTLKRLASRLLLD